MSTVTHRWTADGVAHALTLVRVDGTEGRPYRFGEGDDVRDVEVAAFHVATVPVTQALWRRVMGSAEPVGPRGDQYPMVDVSWDDVSCTDGFLDRLNAGPVRADLAARLPDGARLAFRLPTETEWEYAARGGPHWRDGHRWSGGDDVDAVAWYGRISGDHTHPVAGRAANQLGLHDMSGNVWEWCQDTHTSDVSRIPTDGRPYDGDGEERVLRGGCFHNWAVHCTVSKRYAIGRRFHDGCIGFRLVLAPG